jgi:hypothetical protein
MPADHMPDYDTVDCPDKSADHPSYRIDFV